MEFESLPETAAIETMLNVHHGLWPYTGLVFAGPVDAGYPRHIGSCTFVASGGARYVLTAAHVWRAITGDVFLGGQPPHPPLQIPRQVVVPTVYGPGRNDGDGPDLAFLRIPDVNANQLALEKAFYNLDRRVLPPVQDADCYWTILGAPAVRTQYNDPRVDMRLTFLGSRRIRVHASGAFDYVDVRFDRREADNLPSSFAGVSGSGLWQVPLAAAGAGQPYTMGDPVLAGVAFYEEFDDAARLTGFIRAHGPTGLYSHRPGVVA